MRPVKVSGVFLSTPSARRATARYASLNVNWIISIHALREEGDSIDDRWLAAQLRFLSTPSARRATTIPQVKIVGTKISIHALREEGDLRWRLNEIYRAISIHALREEGD